MGKKKVKNIFVLALIILLLSVTKQQTAAWAETAGANASTSPTKMSTYTYVYDENGRLRKAENDTTQFSYTYDANGNLIKKSRSEKVVLKDIGKIEYPKDTDKKVSITIDDKFGKPVNAALPVQGWYLSTKPADKIEVYLDSKLIGVATQNILREDINKLYPDYAQKNSGFSFSYPYVKGGLLTTGQHKIEIKVYNGGKLAYYNYSIFYLTLKSSTGNTNPVEPPGNQAS